MKPSLVFLAVITGAALALSPVAASSVPPPPNDNFANAMVLTGQAVSSTPVTIDNATREGLERQDTEGQTVWYTWVAPQDGIVTMTTAGTNYHNHLSVFNGDSLADLVAIIETDGDYTASVTFFVKAGFAYQMSIGAQYSSAQGTAVLNINNKPTTITAPSVVAAPANANDNFANALTLPGPTVSGLAYPAEASREGQEPSYTGNRTVWWKWTAPADVEVTMNTAGTEYHNVLTVFNGTTLTDLTLIDQADGDYTATVVFPAKAGAVFYVCVGAQYSDAGTDSIVNITTAPLSISAPVVIGVLPGAANDNFASAQDLGNAPDISSFGYDGDATRETLERDGTGNKTLWWTWTAPADAEVTMTTKGSNSNPILYVFNGDSLSTLGLVAADQTSVSFPAKAGFVYHMSIGDLDDNTNRAPVLNITTAPLAITSPVIVGSLAAANDNFADAASLGSSPVVSGFGYNDDAGVEQLEPSSFGSKTLWWTWTAPSDGLLSVDTRGTDINPVLTAGSGNSVTTLGPSTNIGTVATPASGTITVAANTVYHFAVGSRDSNTGGRLVLNLNFTPGIAHINLAPDSHVVHLLKTSNAAFTVTRDGDLSKKLVVNFKIKLSIGARSSTIKATKKFKPGKSSAKIDVQLHAYEFGTAKGTLKLTITDGEGYTATTPYKAKVTVEE